MLVTKSHDPPNKLLKPELARPQTLNLLGSCTRVGIVVVAVVVGGPVAAASGLRLAGRWSVRVLR